MLLLAVPRYVTNLQQEQAHGLPYPDDPVDQYRATHGLDNSTRKPRSNDLTTMVEAQLGKPTHLLEEDKLKQFLQVGTDGLEYRELASSLQVLPTSWAVWAAAAVVIVHDDDYDVDGAAGRLGDDDMACFQPHAPATLPVHQLIAACLPPTCPLPTCPRGRGPC
jgi:hypothetical protein